MKLRFPFKVDFDALVAAGWTVVHGEGYAGDYSVSKEGGYRHVKLENEALKMKIRLNYNFKRAKDKWDRPMFDGHTSFYLVDGWRSFDRLGVEDSFYVEKGDNLNDSIAKQVKRVVDRRDAVVAAGGFVDIPELGWKVTKARHIEMTMTLASGKPVSLTPSGFGRGYTLYPKPVRFYGIKHGSPKLCKFFGVDSLFVHETEHD